MNEVDAAISTQASTAITEVLHCLGTTCIILMVLSHRLEIEATLLCALQ